MIACLPISILVSLATPVIALAVAVIAYLQWQVAHDRLRLDLFDRRYKVYEAARKFIAITTMETPNFDDSHLLEFNDRTSSAVFLFKSDIVDYLSDIRKRAVTMRMHYELYQPTGTSENERVKHINSEQEEKDWLFSQLAVMPKIFSPYLGFPNIKPEFV